MVVVRVPTFVALAELVPANDDEVAFDESDGAQNRRSAVLHSIPNGMPAISRGVERSDTPGSVSESHTHPGGMPDAFDAVIPPGCEGISPANRGYRCAQPPANGFDSFGINRKTRMTNT